MGNSFSSLREKVIVLCMVCALSLSGCNRELVDVNYKFDYAYIALPNGECIKGKVESWRDYKDGDQIQVKINGVKYLTDTTPCVLVSY